ncbi:MAG: chorismate lyase [Nitrosomonadales bacterium]|jgi:chorismate-pyruvate lyase|nr:chorismate lyase [Nitrosomonadales bacterium]MBT5150700.1 chorismate lyase [Nitrosomonadales bacterium]MBT6015431.1 chorismate lyase [Nitrosomonadales bacterium]MBT6251436.1 chorismate lyase [Nitrosomonadales bacterium]MBT7120710.1 chorismate lyase [Nitrosomonadales bacterium]
MRINWKKRIQKGNSHGFLTFKNSITKQIRNKANLKIQRNKEFPNKIFNDEKLFFKTNRSGSLFLREVLIYADDRPIIYARTIFKKNLRQLTSIVKKLNDNPLANIVFKKKTSRSDFIFSHLSPNHKLAKKLNLQNMATEKVIGARRSNFECNGEKILLTEILFRNINSFK